MNENGHIRVPQPKRPRGRPTKLTPDVKTQIVTALRMGAYLVTALAHANIDDITHRGWMVKGAKRPGSVYGDYARAVKKAMEDAELEMLGHIRAQGLGLNGLTPQWTALAWILERTRPKKYGLRIQMEVQDELSQWLTRVGEHFGESSEVYAQFLQLIAPGESPSRRSIAAVAGEATVESGPAAGLDPAG